MTSLIDTAPSAPVPVRRRALLGLVLASAVLVVAGLAAVLLIRPASSVAFPVAVGLSGGGRLSHPAVDRDGIAFDIAVPPLAEGRFLVLVSWTAGAATWELVAAPNDLYLQWAAGGQNQLWVLPGPVDDGIQRHVAIELTHGVSVTLDGRAALDVSEHAPAGPPGAVIFNAVDG